jgi:hypothetical protein
MVQTFAKSAAADALGKEQMIWAAIDLMHVLDITAKSLAKLPARLDHPNAHFGVRATRATVADPEVAKAAEMLTALAARFQNTTASSVPVAVRAEQRSHDTGPLSSTTHSPVPAYVFRLEPGVESPGVAPEVSPSGFALRR